MSGMEQVWRPSLDRPRRTETASSVALSVKKDNDTASTTPVHPGHQRLVFSDPVALRYLEEDPATTVLERRRRLQGYEIYLVEQWACSRSHPTFVIATYTGDMSQSIFVGVLSVPTDENAWSTRLKVYFQAIQQYHARKKETPLGTLMVTNLSGFPSALTVIPVPDGDIRKHREDFFVNENLKRMGCSGRAGLQLQPPSTTTQAKYWQVYRTSEKVLLYTSVIELVKLCQLALVIFDKLKPAYADGLLCDVTERALTDWWSDIGTDMYNLEPNDGILGPTTVSALIGLLMGSHNRLKATGAPVTKDPFDINATKRAIAYFQKTQKLPRSRRLDRQTIERLQRVTAKAASGEGWTVPRAVKSTVAELSGKGGEMVMGIVGAREKAGISDIETLDIERFSQLVIGARARWLWQGKPIKPGATDFTHPPEQEDMVFAKDDEGGYMWTAKRRDTLWEGGRSRTATTPSDAVSLASTDQKSGLTKLKDRVGISTSRSHLSYHHHRPSKDLIFSVEDKKLEDFVEDEEMPRLDRQETYFRREERLELSTGNSNEANVSSSANGSESKQSLTNSTPLDFQSPNIVISHADGEKPTPQKVPDAAKETADDVQTQMLDLDKYQDTLPSYTREPESRYVRRSRSAFRLRKIDAGATASLRLPRHPSFSIVESSVLTWEDVDDRNIHPENAEPPLMMKQHEIHAEKGHEIFKKIQSLEQITLPWTVSNVELIDDLEETSGQHTQELSNLYHQRLDDFLTLQSHSTDIVNEERLRLNEGVRRVDVLGAKLDYELNALESRIEDVEDGVTDFEKNIAHIESRIDDLLKGASNDRSWGSWFGWSSRTGK